MIHIFEIFEKEVRNVGEWQRVKMGIKINDINNIIKVLVAELIINHYCFYYWFELIITKGK